MKNRIMEYFACWQNARWDKTWDFFSKDKKEDMAKNDPPLSEAKAKEAYIDFLNHEYSDLKQYGKQLTIKIKEIKYQGNKAYVLITWKFPDGIDKLVDIWIFENSNWFLENYWLSPEIMYEVE